MNEAQLTAQLTTDEGRRKRVYTDTKGKVTAGVGRNLSDRDFSEDEIDLMLHNDVQGALRDLDRNIPWWRLMSEDRQQALANMCFNMGIAKLLAFRKTLSLLQVGQYQQAAVEMLNSDWAKQVHERANRLSDMIRTG